MLELEEVLNHIKIKVLGKIELFFYNNIIYHNHEKLKIVSSLFCRNAVIIFSIFAQQHLMTPDTTSIDPDIELRGHCYHPVFSNSMPEYKFIMEFLQTYLQVSIKTVWPAEKNIKA